MAEDNSNLIHVYLDDEDEPIVSYRPPVRFELDTTQLEDGPHTLKVVATDATGHEGVRTIPFEVRNGPGIDIEGLQDNDMLEGKVPILLNAYGGAKEPILGTIPGRNAGPGTNMGMGLVIGRCSLERILYCPAVECTGQICKFTHIQSLYR